MEIPVSHTFHLTHDAMRQGTRFVSSCGGTRSGKTYAILQLLWWQAMADTTPTVTSVVSETMPHLKRGAIRDFQSVVGTFWDDSAWNKTDCIYTFPNGSIIEFFSVDSPAKVHGPARDRLFVNEAQNLSYEVIRQLLVRTKGQVIFDYNPTHTFWLNELIEQQKECVTVHSTYLDNLPFLSEEQVAEIERNRTDRNWWRVYGEGLIGQLEGQIYDFEQVDELPQGDYVRSYGMDFGYTHDPSVCVLTLIDTGRKEIWLDELFYKKGMLNADMAAAMAAAGVPQYGTPIYGDAAEPKTIDDLHGYGYNIKPCYKATRKAEQIQLIRGYRLKVTKRSTNTIKELRGYVWAKDKDGRDLNEPIAIQDHAMDAFRYSVFTHLTQGMNNTFDFRMI